jgi:pyruvate kinase
MLESMI